MNANKDWIPRRMLRNYMSPGVHNEASSELRLSGKRTLLRSYKLAEIGAPLPSKIFKRSENRSVLENYKLTIISFINSHIFSSYYEITANMYCLIFGAI
jgi:hypothetical protein